MTKRGIRAIYSMLGLVALWFTSAAVANAQVTVTSVKVTETSAALTSVYCDTTVGCGASGGIQLWNLGGGVTLTPGQTLVLTQNGALAPGEGDFDTSDQVTPTTVGSCSTTNPCTVTIEINGVQVYNSSAGIPLNFGNKDDGGNVTNEAANWVLATTQPTFTLATGYADNSHSAGCPGGISTNCFPSPFTGATVFIGAGLDTDGSCLTGNCYDGGALLITALAAPFTGCTVTQGGWGAPPHGNNPAAFLVANFPAGGVTIGLGFPSVGPPFSLHFNSAKAVQNFLPQGGPPGALSVTALNPTARTSAGVFAGQVLALTLNAQLKGFGSYVLSGTGTSFDGKTVTQVLAAADQAISGGALPTGFSYSSLNDLVDKLNNLFDNCG